MKTRLSTMVDFHSHMLPQMDDGSSNLEESLDMLKMSHTQGVELVCLTPHFYATQEEPGNFLRRREESLELLKNAPQDGLPGYIVGAEVHYFDGLSKIEELEKLCIGGSHFILIEMPFCEWQQRNLNELDSILNRGFQPILAHIERYPCFRKEDYLGMLCESGLIIQSNGEAFLHGLFSRRALRYLQEGLIHILGSDSHHKNTRSPNLKQAKQEIEKHCGAETWEHIIANGNSIMEEIGGSL